MHLFHVVDNFVFISLFFLFVLYEMFLKDISLGAKKCIGFVIIVTRSVPELVTLPERLDSLPGF